MRFLTMLLAGTAALGLAAVSSAQADAMSLSKGTGVAIYHSGHMAMGKPNGDMMQHARKIEGDVLITMDDDGNMWLYEGPRSTGRESLTH
jgi:hypothetical protein